MATNHSIQIGIDLGTTNSEIAINNNGKIELIKNIFGDEYTPSVFGIDKAKNKIVGKRAYERLYKDASVNEFKNNKAEIKRLMGILETIYFDRANLTLNAEEISSEILKSLKEDILRKYPNINTTAAVITVPAYFSILQSEATKRAGNLAGFKHVVLLQEPIAAAVSYGFMNATNENWLIYDLGGGTFDVALISSRDGVLSVLGHSGDNFLGGKDIDWLVVDKIIVPKILDQYSIENFHRGNDQYSSTFSKLKYIAETAKISLSQYDKTSIEVDGIGSDNNGKEIYISIDFTRKDFEKLINSIVDRTIDLSKETLKEAGIKNTSVKKIILVGGPTRIPYIKERLEDELKIRVDSSVDPLTVVANGACIFAISQRIPEDLLDNQNQNTDGHNITLNYTTLTSENEETISGIVKLPKELEGDHYIQIQSDSGLYSGSRIKLRNGKFFDTIAIEPYKENLFWLYLFDDKGNSIPLNADSFTITHGLSISGPPIPHSIGVVVAKRDSKNNFALTEVFERFFEKGSTLPLKKTDIFKTARRLTKGGENPLWIKVAEGESDIPDRNTYICELGIKGSELPYDLPEGTEIEITVFVNESRELFVNAYISLIDLTLNARATFKDEIINVNDIEEKLNIQIDRAKNISEICNEEEQNSIVGTIQSVTTSIKNAHLDEDEKRKANKQLKDLTVSLDQLEQDKQMPQLIKEFNVSIEKVKNIIDEYADQKENDSNNELLQKMKEEGEKAISNNDKQLLIRVNEQIDQLKFKALNSNPATWVYRFDQISQNDLKFLNAKEAEYYIQKGKRAIELNDLDELKRCYHSLMLLLPSDDQETIKSNLSGITR